MIGVVQRVTKAVVRVNGEEVSGIGIGLLLLLGIEKGDGTNDTRYLCRKVARLRVFSDERSRIDWSVEQAGGSILVVSQFTLLGDCRHANRPSFLRAAPRGEALGIYHDFLATLKSIAPVPVLEGAFGEDMSIELCNSGPVTLILDSRNLQKMPPESQGTRCGNVEHEDMNQRG